MRRQLLLVLREGDVLPGRTLLPPSVSFLVQFFFLITSNHSNFQMSKYFIFAFYINSNFIGCYCLLLQLSNGHPSAPTGLSGSGQILQFPKSGDRLGIQSRLACIIHYRLLSSVRHSLSYYSYYCLLKSKILGKFLIIQILYIFLYTN